MKKCPILLCNSDMISFLMASTLSFSNISSASDSVSLIFPVSWFMCGTVGVLAMVSKSGIEKLLDSLLNELDKLWESVWFIFGVSKKLPCNMIGVFSMIFSAKTSTIFTYMKGLLISIKFIYNFLFSFKVMYFLQVIFFSKVLHTSSFNKLFVYAVNVGSFVLVFQFVNYCNNVCI